MLHVMTSSNSSDRSLSAVRADVKMWPQLLPFRQPISIEHPSRFFVVAIFISMAIHAFLVYLLCFVVADRTAIGPTAPSIGTPLIVSLVSLPATTTASHDGLDREVVSAEPHTDPVVKNAQFSPERSRSIERKSESESVMISNDQGVPGAEAPVAKSPAADATPSTKLEAAGHIAREVIRIPEFEAGLVLTSKGQGGLGPEAPEGKFLATGTTPSIDLEAAIAREVERMSMTEFELQDFRSKSIALYQKNHLSPDCPSAFAGGGLIALPFFLKDIITGNGYKWFIQEDLERQKDTQERVEFMSDLMDVNDTFKQ